MPSDVFETLVGRLVLERGWVTQDQLMDCLRAVGSDITNATGASANTNSLSELLLTRGFVKETQLTQLRDEVTTLLKRSPDFKLIRKDDVLFGRMVIQKKFATKEQIDECLQEQMKQAKKGDTAIMRLGEILIQKGFVSFNNVEEMLKLQKSRVELICVECKSRYQVVEYAPEKKYICKKCTGPLVKPEKGVKHISTTAATVVARPKDEAPKEVIEKRKDPKAVFGKYVLIKQLGQGGMGAVYKAWDTALRRWVAVKTLMAEGSEDISRFQREAQMAAQLRHPNIVGIFEVDKVDDRHYIAMELIEGDTLAGRKLKLRRSIEIMREVAHAVEYAHRKGIVHRDIKPHNIMLDRKYIPFVMDFGLARPISGASSITLTGTVVGTPSYMPPEQARGRNRQMDARSDVYSLGAVLYEMVSGRPPFKGTSPVDTLHQVVHKEAIPPRTHNSTIPNDIETIILKAMDKEQARRYPTAKAFADDLDRWLEGAAIEAKPMSLITRATRKAKKHAAVLVSAVVILVVLLGVVIGGSISSSNTRAQVDSALKDAREHLKNKRWEQALLAYDRVINLEPANLEANEGKSTAQDKIDENREYERFQKDEAERKRLAAENRKKEDERKRKEREEARKKAQPEYDAGKQELEEAQRDLYRRGADLSRMDRRLIKAIGHFTKAVDLNPDFPEAFHLRGRAHALRFDNEKAISDFTNAARLMPTFSSAIRDRGKLYLEMYLQEKRMSQLQSLDTLASADNLTNKAMADFLAAEKLSGGSKEKLYLSAVIAFAQNKPDAAVAILSLLLKDAPHEEFLKLRADAHMSLYYQSLKREHIDSAVRDYNRSLDMRVNYYEAIRMRGMCHYILGDTRKALEDFNAGLKINPRNADAWYDVGIWYYRSRKPEEAETHFRKAIEINADHYMALSALGVLQLNKRSLDEAATLLDRAIRVNPGYVSALINREAVRAYQGETGQAIDNLTALLRKHKENTRILHMRAQLNFAANRIQDALDDARRVLEIDPKLKANVQPLIDRCKQILGGD